MGAAPTEQVVDAVSAEGKVSLAGHPEVWFDVLPKGTPVSHGKTIKGWANLEGKYGPYFKIAEDRAPRSNGSSPSDDSGMIFGWACNLAVQELSAGVDHNDVLKRAEQILAARADTSPPGVSPAAGQGEGADQPGLTPKVPF